MRKAPWGFPARKAKGRLLAASIADAGLRQDHKAPFANNFLGDNDRNPCDLDAAGLRVSTRSRDTVWPFDLTPVATESLSE